MGVRPEGPGEPFALMSMDFASAVARWKMAEGRASSRDGMNASPGPSGRGCFLDPVTQGIGLTASALGWILVARWATGVRIPSEQRL